MFSCQCCGSGSGIQCIFTPKDPGSGIPTTSQIPYIFKILPLKMAKNRKNKILFEIHMISSKTYCCMKKVSLFFPSLIFAGCGSGIKDASDPDPGYQKMVGSGKNIPDPQHCLLLIQNRSWAYPVPVRENPRVNYFLRNNYISV
jgi:hypothetical protein